MTLYEFPSPVETVLTLVHDTAGWSLQSHLGTHPSNGAPCQVFDLPDGTPNGNGVTLTIPGYPAAIYHGVLYLDLPTGAGLVIDIWPPANVNKTLPRLVESGQYLAQE